MLGRLISTIVCLVLLVFFAGFNLDNKCDVNLLFHTFKEVPVFVSIIVAFVSGVVFTLPFVFLHRAKSERRTVKTQENKDGRTGGMFSKKGGNPFKKSAAKSDSAEKKYADGKDDPVKNTPGPDEKDGVRE